MQKLGEFLKIQEICYMIGTKFLKVDSEKVAFYSLLLTDH